MTKSSPPIETNATTFWENVTTDNLTDDCIDFIEIMLFPKPLTI